MSELQKNLKQALELISRRLHVLAYTPHCVLESAPRRPGSAALKLISITIQTTDVGVEEQKNHKLSVIQRMLKSLVEKRNQTEKQSVD